MVFFIMIAAHDPRNLGADHFKGFLVKPRQAVRVLHRPDSCLELLRDTGDVFKIAVCLFAFIK